MNMNMNYIDIIKMKGLDKITVDELVAEITPRGRGNYY